MTTDDENESTKPPRAHRPDPSAVTALGAIFDSWSPNRQAVYRAIAELCEVNKPATRQAITEAAGVPFSIVDDHVKNLKTDGYIHLVGKFGMFAPVEQTPDRSISGTITPAGRYLLEIGDKVLDLSMREARMVAGLTAGVAIQFGR